MLFSKLSEKIDSLDTSIISEERKAVLQPLIDFIQSKVDTKQMINLNFICTHNSRRSHLSQAWAQATASYFGIENLFCYSAGTEATALFPVAAETLSNSGFKVDKLSKGNNPVYSLKYAENAHPIIGFSKTINSEFNPQNGFAAIMTCSSADQGCPFIAGAEKRIPITYEDPKIADGTPQQAEKYLERSTQIATEMKFVFSQIKH
ncbi:MAG: protein-tyrosine-phosphatase [Winogradskyella sp.]|uniref:Protein-tyrosine-phosphatase n=1 Tax=Winogradskyella poriferorum TaxID=307627 RepID=A0ABU7W6T4_9FLAO|nr:protein-tyrosine-phosphatase [Winogradskyella sp.]|tara:strand:- start:524 stop:1138 length:615 start_codon:yes stop_codon:yes gene_type:complete